MPGHLLFVILMCSFHQIQVQALLPPKLVVNTAVITETDSVTLNCRAPKSVSVSQCFFYTGEQEATKGFSCMQRLTGSELLLMSHQNSPAEVEVRCFYTVKYEAGNSPSPHSDPISISIQRQKPQMNVQHFDGEQVVVVCSLPGSVKDNTRCNLYFGEASRPVQRTTVWKKSSSKQERLCMFYVPIYDFLRYLHFVQQKDASCDHSLESEPNSLSPRSDGYSMKGILEKESPRNSLKSASTTTTAELSLTTPSASTSTTSATSPSGILEKESLRKSLKSASTTTTGKLSLTTPSASTSTTSVTSPSGSVAPNLSTTIILTCAVKTTENLALGNSTAAGNDTGNEASPIPKNPSSKTTEWMWVLAAIGLGVTAGVILLVLAVLKSKRTERYSPKRAKASITENVCMTNTDHGQMLPECNDGLYSVITSVPGGSCLTGTKNLNWQGIKNEASDIYHVYATISEDPAVSASQDLTYSMLQAH